MSYTVLARKWRPKKFSELVGQAHVMQALANALDQQRLHHAYLFTGTRGVGKTTIARIFSKALNCEEGISSTPCGVCDTCRSIDEGRFIDLIEVDAASKTKVDDTREILDNVQFAPTQGRYKVYLIDEVHMLSKSSFNALLKTLEEPPEHVKLLLATTDPHKLPITVLSRCLQFNLMRLTQLQIQTHLEFIMEQEDLPFESNALALIAKGADGSARDALSLLDQAIAYGAGEVLFQPVQTMLGLVDQQYSLAILQALAANDPQLTKQSVQQLASMGVDYQALLSQLIETLHALSYYQVFGDNASSMSIPDDVLVSLAAQISPERVQLLYQIALLAKQDVQLAPDIRIGFEMALIRMLAFQPASNGPATVAPEGTANTAQPSTRPQMATADNNQQSSAISEASEKQNALSGLATARSLVGKKVVPRTDFIKEEQTTDYSDQTTSAETIQTEQASVEASPVVPSVEATNDEDSSGQFVTTEQGSNLPVDSMLAPDFSENSPPWEQNDSGQMDEQYPEGYFGEPLVSPGGESFAEPFASSGTQVPGVQPESLSNVPDNSAQMSSSDHLAKIKERLKQPLGKPSKATSSQADFSQDSVAGTYEIQDQLNQQTIESTVSSESAPGQSVPQDDLLQPNGLSAVSPAQELSTTSEKLSPAQNALNQLQAMQQPSNGTTGSPSSFFEDAQAAVMNTQQGFGAAAESQVEPESISAEILANEPAEELGEIHYDSNIENWLEIIKQLSLKGMAAEIARNSVLVEFAESYMAVSIDPAQNYSNQEAALTQFAEAVKGRFGETMVLEFVMVNEHFTPAKHVQQLTADKQAQAVQSIGQDAVVQAFSQQLGMQVIPDSIQPV
jgi:DNA polymerase-3 subunit gamma/tau